MKIDRISIKGELILEFSEDIVVPSNKSEFNNSGGVPIFQFTVQTNPSIEVIDWWLLEFNPD